MQEMNLDCVIMARATIRTAAIDRVKKTDRHDARGVAQALANNAYKPVHVPTETDLEIWRSVITFVCVKTCRMV